MFLTYDSPKFFTTRKTTLSGCAILLIIAQSF